jgi:hypothetical protein
LTIKSEKPLMTFGWSHPSGAREQRKLPAILAADVVG